MGFRVVAVGDETGTDGAADADLAASETRATLQAGLRSSDVDAHTGPDGESGAQGALWSTSRAHGLMLAMAALRPVPEIVFRASEVRAPQSTRLTAHACTLLPAACNGDEAMIRYC